MVYATKYFVVYRSNILLFDQYTIDIFYIFSRQDLLVTVNKKLDRILQYMPDSGLQHGSRIFLFVCYTCIFYKL